MGIITLPNFRTTADVTARVRLKDGGLAIDWSEAAGIKAWLYSDAQKAISGRFDVSVIQKDHTLLKCDYSATKPQYLGVNRIIVQATFRGRTKTYDKAAFNFVPRTSDVPGDITIEDPVVDLEIEVSDVSSSILDEVIYAAIAATEKANEAAEQIPLQVLTEAREATAEALDAAEEARAAGIDDVEADADNNVGTPSVDATLENKKLTLHFHNIKGLTGNTPHITIGTISTLPEGSMATVTLRGTADDPIIDIGIPVGATGAQGNTGSSVDYPFELVNNLSTDDATKGLSAAQGKVLNERVVPLETVVKGVVTKEITWSSGWINGQGTISSSSVSKFSQPFVLKKGERVTVGTQNSNICIIGSTTADSLVVGNTITVIQMTTTSEQFETYQYTAANDIKIVLCVLASNYTLVFDYPDNIEAKLENIDDAPEQGSNHFVKSGGVSANIEAVSNTVFDGFRGKNLFALSKFKSGVMLIGDGRESSTSANYGCTPFISVEENTNYIISSLTSYYLMPSGEDIVFFFGDNGGFISKETVEISGSSYVFTTPVGCHFVRFNLSSLYGLNYTQLEAGNTRTAYEEYRLTFNNGDSLIKPEDFDSSCFDRYVSDSELLLKSKVVKGAIDEVRTSDVNASLKSVGKYSVKCYETLRNTTYELLGGVVLNDGQKYNIHVETASLWTGASVYVYLQHWSEDGGTRYSNVSILDLRDGQSQDFELVPYHPWPNAHIVLYGAAFSGELTLTVSTDTKNELLYFNKNQVKLAEKSRFENEWLSFIYGCKYKSIDHDHQTPAGYYEAENAYKRMAIMCFTDSHIDYYPYYNSGNEYSLENVSDNVDYVNYSKIKNPNIQLNGNRPTFDCILHMGDIVTTNGERTKEFEKTKQNMFFDRVKKSSVPVLFSKGNHDCNDMGNKVGLAFDDADWQGLWYGYAESNYGIVRQTKGSGEKSTWHYLDFDEYKVRIVVLDGQDANKNIATPSDDALYDGTNNKIMYDGSNGFYISQEQFSWVVNNALNFDDKDEKDWVVIFAVHQYRLDDGASRHSVKYQYEASTPKLFDCCVAFNNGTTYTEQYTFDPNNTGSTDLDVNPYAFFNLNINADFTRYANLDKKPKVAMWLMGHNHYDYTVNDRGIQRVWVLQGMASARTGDQRVQRVVGTRTQNAFDMILIDNIERTIRFIRYGAGKDCFGVGGDRFMPDGLSY